MLHLLVRYISYSQSVEYLCEVNIAQDYMLNLAIHDTLSCVVILTSQVTGLLHCH